MDNDEATLSITDADALEDAGTMGFTVSLSPQSTQTVTVAIHDNGRHGAAGIRLHRRSRDRHPHVFPRTDAKDRQGVPD